MLFVVTLMWMDVPKQKEKWINIGRRKTIEFLCRHTIYFQQLLAFFIFILFVKVLFILLFPVQKNHKSRKGFSLNVFMPYFRIVIWIDSHILLIRFSKIQLMLKMWYVIFAVLQHSKTCFLKIDMDFSMMFPKTEAKNVLNIVKLHPLSQMLYHMTQKT